MSAERLAAEPFPERAPGTNPGGASMRTADFDYPLPPELIAQVPAPQRDLSRLLVLLRETQRLLHAHFADLPGFLRSGDVLVLNDSQVIPARLMATKEGSGGQVEMLLLEPNQPADWWVMLRPGKRVRVGTRLRCLRRDHGLSNLSAVVREKNPEGHCRVTFEGTGDLLAVLVEYGEVPLPPYITREGGPTEADQERYQTVFAQAPGSVAAPTAGLHFTPALLDRLRAAGIAIHVVTLHVGAATFAPVKVARIEDHRMHAETFTVPPETAAAIQAAKQDGRRIIAVGTTTVRVLETVARRTGGRLEAGSGRTDLFLYPPTSFLVVEGMITNFHLPESSLLMLVSAFVAPGETCGSSRLLAAYAEAVRERYRFFSYGDAMLIL